jgi:putative ABC transport system permease protein
MHGASSGCLTDKSFLKIKTNAESFRSDPPMVRNYFIIALRNLIKGRLYTFINLACLSAGMASFLLIWLFINDERNYDRFHKKADRTYRVVEILKEEGGGEESSSLPMPMRSRLLEHFPGRIESAVRLFNYQSPYAAITYGYKRHIENKFFFTDSSFFDVFDFPLILGDPHKALTRPRSVVISEAAAQRYFGDTDPMGKVLMFDGETDLHVTGVTGKPPGGSHIDFDFLISMESVGPIIERLEKNYVWNPAWTYVVLAEGVSPDTIEAHLPELVTKYIQPKLKSPSELHLQPMQDIHLHSHLDYEMRANGNVENLYILAAVGVFILLIACVNFMNLATARSASRAHEVGIRKVSGATRGQLVIQFLVESTLLCLLATLPALALVELLTPAFNQLTGLSLELNFSEQPGLFLLLLVLALVMGIVSGFYPAIFLSATEPIRVFKGVFQQGRKSIFFRRVLVIFQFSISVMLIIGTFIGRGQLTYLRDAELGFNQENLMMIPSDRTDAWDLLDSLRKGFSAHPGFKGMTTMDYLVGVQTNTYEFQPEGKDSSNYGFYNGLTVDRHFLKTMGMSLVAGRDFNDDPGDDSLAVIINESMVRAMKWKSPEDALGKKFFTATGKERVIGVVKDFHFAPLRQEIGPFVLDLPSNIQTRAFLTKYLAVRFDPQTKDLLIKHMTRVWEEHITSRPFDTILFTDALATNYRFEETLGRLMGYFSALAIFIACLSLFGLSSFATQQRTREIGIRKVLGATVFQIMFMLLGDFARLVFIAILVAIPMAWVAMWFWLRNFPYHTTIPISAFFIAAVIAMAVALFTTSYHALRAAVSNPVDSIRR